MCLYYPRIAWGEALVAAAKGHSEVALERYAQAEQLAEKMGMRPFVLQVSTDIVRVLVSIGRWEEAEVERRKARATIDEIAKLFDDADLRAEFVRNAMARIV